MIGNVINDQFLAVPGGYPVAAALSFTLMAAILAWSSSTSAASAPRNWCDDHDDAPDPTRDHEPPTAYRPSAGKRAQVWLANHFAMISAILVLLYLFLPVAYTFAFSFNDHGKTNIVWQGFTWKHWQDPCGVQGVCESLVTSLEVGVIATVVATVLGTLMALAMVRYRFRARRPATC